MQEFELEQGEVVVMEVRQHVFILLTRLVPLAVLAVLPLFGYITLLVVAQFVPAFSTIVNALGPLSRALHFLIVLWMFILWSAAFSIFTQYYLTVWTITNVRIVDIRQYAFFNRKVSSFLLARVQDVTTDITGVLGTFLKFGRLSVETAGNEDDFAMEGIADPARIRDVIMSQVAQLHHGNDVLSGV